MKKRNGLIIMIILLVLIPSVLSDSDSIYSELGFIENDYRSGDGEFNENVDEVYKTKALSSAVKYPIVNDFDNDGTNDIFLLDGATAKIYNFDGINIDLITSFVLPATERVSNIISFDIDDDNLTEIIFIHEFSLDLYILEYNGSVFTNETTINLGFSVGAEQLHSVIKCGDVDNCMIVWGNMNSAAGGESLFATSFNSTKVGGNTLIDGASDANDHYCLPQVKNMVYTDYNDDGISEYVASSIFMDASLIEDLNIYVIDSGTNLIYHIEDELTNFLTVGASCSGVTSIGRYISSPLVDDFVTGGTKEFVIGANLDDDEYKIFIYDGVGCSGDDNCLNDEFPKSFKADGKILGNPILSDVFSDSGIKDFCIFGYHDVDEELTLLCGSKNTNSFLGFLDSMEFVYSTDGQYNLSSGFDEYAILGHSGEHKTQSTGIGFGSQPSTNHDEFITSYGVFEVEDVTFNGSAWRKTLTRIFENTRGETAIIPVDYGKLNANDLIGLQSNNLIYIDDGLSTAPSRITFYEFNPCPINTILKLNTTMDVSVIVTDQNPELIGPDPVSAKITVYEGDVNFQNQTLINFTSGAEFQAVDFKLNKTIVNGNIKLEVWDTSHPTTIDTIDISFTVATNGLEFNDVKCEEDLLAEIAAEGEEEEADLVTESAADNGIITGLRGLAELTGLSALIWWLLIMAGVAVSIFMGKTIFNRHGGDDSHSRLGVILLVEILLIIIGTLIGVMPVGIVITIVVIGLISLGLFLNKKLTGTET